MTPIPGVLCSGSLIGLGTGVRFDLMALILFPREIRLCGRSFGFHPTGDATCLDHGKDIHGKCDDERGNGKADCPCSDFPIGEDHTQPSHAGAGGKMEMVSPSNEMQHFRVGSRIGVES